MDRRTCLTTLAAASLPALPSMTWAQTGDATMPALGKTMVLPDVPLLDGGVFKAAEAKGQVVVLYWWASWCPFCAAMTPSMQKLWLAQRSRGLKVLGISIDKRVEDARQYMTRRGYTFPSGHNTPELERVLPKPGGKALPVTCVLGRDGRVVMAEKGQLFDEDVQQIADFL